MSLFDDFRSYLNSAGRTSTATTYGFLWRPFAKWMSEHGRDAEKFTVADAQEYLASRSDVSDTTKNAILATFKRFARWCQIKTTDAEERNRLEQIKEMIRLKPMKLIKRKALTIPELKQLIDVARDMDASRIYLLAYLGLRKGELPTLHDIDFKEGRLIVVGEKSRSERVLFFNAECGRVLRLAIEKGWLKNKLGSLNEQLKRYDTLLTGIKLTPHRLRHTFCTNMRGRISEPLLRTLMGWEEATMADTYTSAFEPEIKEAMTTKHYLADFFVPIRIKEMGAM